MYPIHQAIQNHLPQEDLERLDFLWEVKAKKTSTKFFVRKVCPTWTPYFVSILLLAPDFILWQVPFLALTMILTSKWSDLKLNEASEEAENAINCYYDYLKVCKDKVLKSL